MSVERCLREIAEIDKRAIAELDIHPAYLFVMGRFDWLAEYAILDAERRAVDSCRTAP